MEMPQSRQMILRLILRAALWGMVAYALPLVWDRIAALLRLMPNYYVAICVFLFVLGEVSLLLLRRRCYLYYLFFLIGAYVAFAYMPSFLASLDLCRSMNDLRHGQRLRVNYGALTMFCVVAATSVIWHLFVLHRERQAMMRAKLQAELAMLKAQMIPHFFFNSLNSIYSLALAKDDKAPDAIITLSDMMRYVLTDAKADWVDLSQELTYLNRYVELQRLRLPHQTKLDYRVEKEGTYRIPPMLLISFFENAFKYGLSSQKEETITIHLKVADKRLCLTTRNAIVVAKKSSNSTGNGIANARRRLELSYPNRYELLASEEQGYYHVKLSIELR